MKKLKRRARKAFKHPWARVALQLVGIVILVTVALTVVDALFPKK